MRSASRMVFGANGAW